MGIHINFSGGRNMPETRDKGWILDDSSLAPYMVKEKEGEETKEPETKEYKDVQKPEKL